MALGNSFYLPTGAVCVAPLADPLCNLGHGEAEAARLQDEAEYCDFTLTVFSISGLAAFSFRQQTCLLVVADHLGRYACRPGCIADVHECGHGCSCAME